MAAPGVRAELVLGALQRRIGRESEAGAAHAYLRQRVHYEGGQRLMDPQERAVMMAWEGCAASRGTCERAWPEGARQSQMPSQSERRGRLARAHWDCLCWVDTAPFLHSSLAWHSVRPEQARKAEARAAVCRPLMEAHAHAVCAGQGDVLNVGFGLGPGGRGVCTAVAFLFPANH